MNGRIDVDLAMGEGALLRVLGLVERRGFSVLRLALDQAEGRGALSMQVEARDAGRRLDVVAGQLRRLHDVQAVSCSVSEESPVQ